MTLVGCDLHTRKQQVAVLDTETGEMYERHLSHAGDAAEQLYRALPGPVTVGIRAHRVRPVVSRTHAAPGPEPGGAGAPETPQPSATVAPPPDSAHP
jgi:hypothetical protein